MVRSVPEDYFVKCSSLKITDNGAADIKRTWGLYYHHENIMYGSYNDLEETLNNFNSLKLNSYPGGVLNIDVL